MKRLTPNLPSVFREQPLSEAIQNALFEEDAVEHFEFDHDECSNFSESELEFSGCVFRNVLFSALDIQKIHFSDCEFIHCDISGIPFRDGTMIRCTFTDCRMIGCSFDQMLLRDVLFSDCVLNYAAFTDSKAERCEYSGCDLSEGTFFGFKTKSWSISHCKMHGVQIRECSLAGIDLCDSEIADLSAPADALRGMTVSFSQAPEILSLFGVRIRS